MDLVFLHGGPAAGKLTTAVELSRIIEFPVFHNHLVVDLLLTLFPFGSESFIQLREEFWLATFSAAAKTGRSMIFTFTPEGSVERGFPERVRAVIESNGGRVCFVRLVVSDEEQERRIDNPSRMAFAKEKSVAGVREHRRHLPSVEQPPVDLEIDTDGSDPEKSAATIARHFGLVAV